MKLFNGERRFRGFFGRCGRSMEGRRFRKAESVQDRSERQPEGADAENKLGGKVIDIDENENNHQIERNAEKIHDSRSGARWDILGTESTETRPIDTATSFKKEKRRNEKISRKGKYGNDKTEGSDNEKTLSEGFEGNKAQRKTKHRTADHGGNHETGKDNAERKRVGWVEFRTGLETGSPFEDKGIH